MRATRSRRSALVLFGAVALAIPAAGLAGAPDAAQPDGSGPVPPYQPDPLATAPQPDGSGPVPPVVLEVAPRQPPNPNPDRKGKPTQVQGPDEPDAGIDGADRPGGREDVGGVDGSDTPGGRDD